MKKTLSLILALVMVAFAFAACTPAKDVTSDQSLTNGTAAPTADTTAEANESAEPVSGNGDLEYVKNNGKMLIGYTVYEPMNYTDAEGNFTGFDTEFAQAVCEKLGVEPEFVEIVWDMKVVELNSKAIDCIWNGMTINDDLKAQIAISDPYVKNMQVIIINKKNAEAYKDTLSLADKDIVVEAGSAGESVVLEEENLKNANCIQVTKQIDALLEVKAGTADAAVLDWTLAKSMIGEGTDYEDLMIVEGVELSVEEYGIGFRADSDLCTEVNKIMAELIADGTLPALAEKYGLSLAE